MENKPNGTRITLVYDAKGELTISAPGVPAAMAIWMLESAKVNIITGGGKRRSIKIEGLDLSPLNPRKLR